MAKHLKETKWTADKEEGIEAEIPISLNKQFWQHLTSNYSHADVNWSNEPVFHYLRLIKD
jgi:hypothetical protein